MLNESAFREMRVLKVLLRLTCEIWRDGAPAVAASGSEK